MKYLINDAKKDREYRSTTTLVDLNTGREAVCGLVQHGDWSAAEIPLDAAIRVCRRFRCLTLFTRLLKKDEADALQHFAEWFGAKYEFACGLYVSDHNGERAQWLSDNWVENGVAPIAEEYRTK